MDQWHTLSQAERKKLLEEKTKSIRQGVPATLRSLLDEKHPSMQASPVQLELPLEWTHHVTQEPLSKVSEPCTNPMQSRS